MPANMKAELVAEIIKKAKKCRPLPTSCIHHSDLAARYTAGDTAKPDLYDKDGPTKDGLYTANLGAGYMSALYRFGEPRLSENKISFPPTLPQG